MPCYSVMLTKMTSAQKIKEVAEQFGWEVRVQKTNGYTDIRVNTGETTFMLGRWEKDEHFSADKDIPAVKALGQEYNAKTFAGYGEKNGYAIKSVYEKRRLS